jgi:hypothetical protein
MELTTAAGKVSTSRVTGSPCGPVVRKARLTFAICPSAAEARRTSPSKTAEDVSKLSPPGAEPGAAPARSVSCTAVIG